MSVFKFKVIFVVLFLVNIAFIQAAPKINDAKWRCARICKASGALKREFDEETSTCKCVFKPNFETAYQKIIRRRRLLQSNNEADITKELNNEEDVKGNILGQSLPVVPLPQLKSSGVKPLITVNTAKRTLLDIQEKLKTLTLQQPTSKAAITQLDTIRASLKDLSGKLIRTPVQNDKIIANRKKLIDQRKAREQLIQQQIQEFKARGKIFPASTGVVGAVVTKDVTTVKPAAEKEVKKGVDENNSTTPQNENKSIITQPEYLLTE